MKKSMRKLNKQFLRRVLSFAVATITLIPYLSLISPINAYAATTSLQTKTVTLTQSVAKSQYVTASGHYWTAKYLFTPYVVYNNIFQNTNKVGGVTTGLWQVSESQGMSGTMSTEQYIAGNYGVSQSAGWYWEDLSGYQYYCPHCGARLPYCKTAHEQEIHNRGTSYEWEEVHGETIGQTFLAENPGTGPIYLWYDLQSRSWVNCSGNSYPTTYGCCCNGSLASNGYTMSGYATKTKTINGLNVTAYKMTDAQGAAVKGIHIRNNNGNWFYNKPLMYNTGEAWTDYGDKWTCSTSGASSNPSRTSTASEADAKIFSSNISYPIELVFNDSTNQLTVRNKSGATSGGATLSFTVSSWSVPSGVTGAGTSATQNCTKSGSYSVTVVPKATIVKGGTTYTATWPAQTLSASVVVDNTVNFYQENGTTKISGGTYSSVASISVPNAPAKANYTFAGYYIGNTQYYNGSKTKVANLWTGNPTGATYNLVAKYVTNYVNFYQEDGTTKIAGSNYNSTSAISVPTAPAKTNYTFTGYYIGNTQYYDASYAKVADLWTGGATGATYNLTAKYITNYVNFYQEDGTTKIFGSNYASTSSISVPTAPAKVGYTFAGYYVGDTQYYNSSYTKVADLWTGGATGATYNLVAKYTPNPYILTYMNDIANSTSGSRTMDVVYDSNYVVSTQFVTPAEGYTFQGWKIGDIVITDVNGVSITPWNYTEDKVANTIYTPNQYTVTYDIHNTIALNDANAGVAIPGRTETDNRFVDTPDVRSDVVTYDAFTQLTNAAKTYPGYTFVGWYDDYVQGTDYASTHPYNGTGNMIFDAEGKANTTGNLWKIANDITVYPKYEPNLYTLNFNLNKEDAVTANTRNIYYDSVFGLTDAEKAARQDYRGYTFIGWYDGNDQIFDADGNNTSGNLWRYLDTVNASATYTANHYTVHYNTNENDIPNIDLDVVFDDPYGLPQTDVDAVPTKPGYTFIGWYDVDTGEKIFNVDGTSVEPLYNFDKDITVVVKYSNNPIDVKISTETDRKVVEGVGNASAYEFDITNRVEYYDIFYTGIDVPSKRGYTFTGYIVDPINNGEKVNIWSKDGGASEQLFKWLPTTGNNEVLVFSTFTPNTIRGTIDAKKYSPKDDKETDNPIHIEEVYDTPYSKLPSIPEKKGYEYDGITDKDGNPIWDKDGNPTQEVWQYIDEDIDDFIIKWTPKWYILVYDNGKTQKVIFDEAVPDIGTMKKIGHTFKGYSFNYFGTDTYIIDNKGKYTGPKWSYDVGPSGILIPLTDLWDVNTYNITVKDNATTSYNVSVVYGMEYSRVTVPSQTGYVFEGYKKEYDVNYPSETLSLFWDNGGVQCYSKYEYAHDISVMAQWRPKTFYLHCGDTVIPVTYDDIIHDKAPTPGKEQEKDANFIYDYSFTGWTYKGTPIFDDGGNSVVGTWKLDVGPDGTHIYLDSNYARLETEIKKVTLVDPTPIIVDPPLPTPPEDLGPPTSSVFPIDEEEPDSEVVVVQPEPSLDDDGTPSNPTVRHLPAPVVITGLIFLLLLLLLLLILFILGQLSYIYVYDEKKSEKNGYPVHSRDKVVWAHRYKKDDARLADLTYKEREITKTYVDLTEYKDKDGDSRYYHKLLDSKADKVSIKFGSIWRFLHKNEMVRVHCGDIISKENDYLYDEYRLGKKEKGEGDIARKDDCGRTGRYGFIHLHLSKSTDKNIADENYLPPKSTETR